MIFLDTGFIHAFVSREDANHHRVREVVQAHRGRRLFDFVLTTNYVVGEAITLIRTRDKAQLGRRHQLAVETGRQLFAGVFGRIHRVTAEEEQDAFAYFERYRDKVYSFVDCLSFVVMEKYGIQEAWAVDDDFSHRFTAIPGPASDSRSRKG